MRYCGKKAEPVVLIQRLSIELLSGIRKSKRKKGDFIERDTYSYIEIQKEGDNGPWTFIYM